MKINENLNVEESLAKQNTRLVSESRAESFIQNSKRHWDIFYKRNRNNFFKDRHWSLREFHDVLERSGDRDSTKSLVLLEVGCGTGNFIFPLIEAYHEDEGSMLKKVDSPIFIHACDFSKRAVDLVKTHDLYNETYCNVFEFDVSDCNNNHPLSMNLSRTNGKVDVISLIFVLSAIHPDKFAHVLSQLKMVLNDGGKILFRDYAVNDMAMLRFGVGTKISDNLYLRQDGTTSYFFSMCHIQTLIENTCGLRIVKLEYVKRKTVNVKEGVDVDRLFIQGVFSL